MPISKEEFQQGSAITEDNILNFLKEHREEAYNAKEIAEAFGAIDRKSDLVRISFSLYSYAFFLDSLVQQKKVIKKVIAGVPYYIFQN